MAGEPSASSLTQVRLQPSSCGAAGELAIERTEALVRQMRAELEASFRDWKANRTRHCRPRRTSGGRLGGSHSVRSSGPAGLGRSGLSVGGIGAGAGSGAGAEGSAAVPARFSGTNTQVASVDEADIVKTDGHYVYVVMNGALRILEARRPRLVSTTPLDGDVKELFVEGDRAVVYVANGGSGRPRCTYGYDCQFSGDGSATRILVLDLSDRVRPRVARELKLSGSLIASRRIGHAVHTVVSDGDDDWPPYWTWPAGTPYCGLRESVVRARFAALERDNERRIREKLGAFTPRMRDRGQPVALCSNLVTTPILDGNVFTTLISFDLGADDAPARTVTVQSRPGAVFASSQALYLTVTHRKSASPSRWYSFWPSTDEVSDVHKFRIGSEPAATAYVGSGVVPGHVLNQFSMDEWHGYLRVATTRGRVPDPAVQSAVSILAEAPGGNLVRVGAVDEIAPGEDIRSVRFDGDRGYVVTFKKTDPLFVLDLYAPDQPRILGELKIPGFSTYLQRIDADHLLSIGFDADDRGRFAYFDGLLLQLFDVAEPTRPRLLHREKIGTRGSSSEAATNHLAFNYFGERRRLGRVQHDDPTPTCGTWWSRATSHVKRSLFVDDLVYSIATDRVKVQHLDRFGVDVADIALAP